VDRVPDVVDVRDLVRDELDRVEHAGGDHHVGALEPVGHLAQPEAPEDPEQQNGRVCVDASGPAA
jgi:hypothetical protein